MGPSIDHAAATVGPRVFLKVAPRVARRGPVDLVRLEDATFQVGAVAVERWEKVCTAPCGVEVDVRDNPRLGLVRDGKLILRPFRLPAQRGEVTLKFRERNEGLLFASLFLAPALPLSIPGFVLSGARVWAAEGPPSKDNKFARIR